VKGGHELGETARQFFFEGHEKEVLARMWGWRVQENWAARGKKVSFFYGVLADARQRAVIGARTNHESGGSPAETREDRFTFEDGV
jgi:hypothetical protein